MTTLSPTEPAIVRGIKTAGVGKKGSKDLSQALIREIADDIRAGKVSPAALGAFFAGLICKGVSPEEEYLDSVFPAGTLRDPQQLVETLAADCPQDIRTICACLLKQETLDRDTAHKLGTFLFSEQPGDGARGMVASLLRVRYETADEYEGLLAAMRETMTPPFRVPVPDGEPVIQLAEPFDGVDHSLMITPALASQLQIKGYRVITLVGRNSGPKLVMNLLDIVQALGVPLLRNNAQFTGQKPSMGWYLDQRDLSPALDRWVDIRHQTVKRPFLATLEKFLDPAQARVLVTSAFHPPYGEKMLTVAEHAGFPGAVVVRNGIEGTIAFPLKREVRMLCTARQTDGSYLRHEIIFDPAAHLTNIPEMEERVDAPRAQDNARVITHFMEEGGTSNAHFDLRVHATSLGLGMAIDWLQHNTKG